MRKSSIQYYIYKITQAAPWTPALPLDRTSSSEAVMSLDIEPPYLIRDL